jgi:hypothetical protein
MWDFLSNIPNGWAIVILILGILATVIIALRGKLKAKFGDKEIDIGTEKTFPIPPPPVTGSFLKRTCGDCVLILMGEREKFELQIRKERDRILKTQMVYAEQKLTEIQTLLINYWIEAIHNSVKNKITTVDESVQYKLIYGLLKDTMIGIKDEIRRSFKDNGFSDIDSSDFSEYVKDRIHVILSMLNQHIRNIYPDRGGVLEVGEILYIIEKQNPYISNIINDVYYHAKDIKIEIDGKLEVIKNSFGKWIDSFILK